MNTQGITIETLQNEIAKRRNKETDLKQQLHDMGDQIDEKERMLKRLEGHASSNRSQDNKIVEELNRTKADNQSLKAQVLMLQSTQGTADDNRKYLHDLTMERNEYQSKLTSLLTDPFFRREAGNEVSQKINNLESENRDLKDRLEQTSEEKMKRDEELNKLKSDFNVISDENHHKSVQGRSGYAFNMGDGSLDLNEMKKALMSMDPSVFRLTMDQLKYDGDEPLWAKIDFLEQLGVDISYDPKDPKSVARRMELMKQDTKELAAALEKAQQLLQLQYDIDKENKAYYAAEVDELNAKIRELTLRLEESRKLGDQRLEEITIMKKTGYAPKRDGTGVEYDKYDADSEFSFATLETDLKHEENMLDFAIDKAEYYPNSLHQIVEADVISEKGFLSFFTVEFYDHDVKATDVTNGLEPSYSTLFSFKNKVDDYYIQFLQSNRVKLELFLNKSQKVKKIGFANVTLREIIERDYDTIEGTRTPIITGIININSSANPSLRIGSIKYKMRMRKSLNEALRWYKEKNDLNTAQRSKKITQQYLHTKIIAISVIRCFDLKSKHTKDPAKIEPFFFYNFYKFDEYYSRTSKGPNPEFNDIKTFSTELDSKFKNYTEEKTFEISVLDDSVNLAAKMSDDDTIDDMIGVAHIPLFDVVKGQGLWDKFTVKDYNGNVNGMIEVKVTVHDSLEDINNKYLQKAELRTDEWSKQFLFKVCSQYVDKPNVNLTSLFSIFSKGEENISRQNFRDTIIPRKFGVSDSEVEMFIKDCEPLQRRGHMNREEFISIMRGPYKMAIQENRVRRQAKEDNRGSDSEDFGRATKQSARHPEEETKGSLMKGSTMHKKSDPIVAMDMKKEHSFGRTVTFDLSRIEVIKAKIKDFMIKDGISLSLFYEYIDKDGDKMLSRDEFGTKIRAVGIDMSEPECEALFKYIDRDNSGEISNKEFESGLADINIEYILNKIKKIVKDVLSTLPEMFEEFDSGEKGYLNEKDYKVFIDEYGGDIKDYTKEIIFKHMDKDNNKRIQLAEFCRAFES